MGQQYQYEGDQSGHQEKEKYLVEQTHGGGSWTLGSDDKYEPNGGHLCDIRPYKSFGDELLSSVYAWMRERMKTQR